MRNIRANQGKAACIGHTKNTKPVISRLLITAILQFSLPWLITCGFSFKYLLVCFPCFPVLHMFVLQVLISSLFCSQIIICHHQKMDPEI